MPRETDAILIDHGTLSVLRPVTDAARDWMAAHLDPNAMQWAGGTVVEPRYLDAIVNGMICDDLTLAMV